METRKIQLQHALSKPPNKRSSQEKFGMSQEKSLYAQAVLANLGCMVTLNGKSWRVSNSSLKGRWMTINDPLSPGSHKTLNKKTTMVITNDTSPLIFSPIFSSGTSWARHSFCACNTPQQGNPSEFVQSPMESMQIFSFAIQHRLSESQTNDPKWNQHFTILCIPKGYAFVNEKHWKIKQFPARDCTVNLSSLEDLTELYHTPLPKQGHSWICCSFT